MKEEIPADIFLEVLTYLRHDKPAILSCSLVSRRFLPICNLRYLFQEIDLSNPNNLAIERKFPAVYQQLKRDPTLASHTQSLRLNLGYSSSWRGRDEGPDGYALARDSRLSGFMLNFKKLEKLELCREAFSAPHGSSKLRESIQQTLALPSLKCLILSNIHGFPFVKEALRLQELVLIDSEPTPNSRVSFYLEVHKARPEINLQSLSFLGESDDCIGMFCPMPEIPNYLLSIPRLVLEASPLCFTFAFDRVTESGTSRLEHLVWLIPDNTPDQIFDFAALLGRQTFSTERLKHLEIIFPGSYPWSLERLMLIERLAGANLSLPALERITIELSGLVERLHALEASIGCFRFADQVPFGTRSPNFRELRINLTPGTELGNEHYSESHMHQARSFIERMFSSIDKSRLLTVNCVPRNSSAVIRDYHSRRPSPSHL